MGFHVNKRGRLRAPLGSEALLGKTLDNRYRVEEWIGGGAFSNVYKGIDTLKEDRPVALKVIHRAHAAQAASHSQFEENNPFEHEARYNQMLKNGWVARAYKATKTKDGLNYIVMEFVDGMTLERWVRSNGPLSPLHSFQLAEGLLAYLAEAHKVGFAHGDIKSSNIMVSNVTPTRFRFKVVDLGHARWFRTPLRPRDHMVGTPAYLAPELVQGGTVDPRAELYAVCVVMYKAVTGESPLQTKRNSADEMIEYLEDSSLPIPSRPLLEFRPDFPPSFAQWIERGLNRNRALRPSSAVDFRNELEKTVAKEALTTDKVKESPLKRAMNWLTSFRGDS